MTTISLPDPSDEPLTMSISEAAAMAGVSRSSGYRAADRGEIPTVRLGRRLLVPKAEFYRLLGLLSDDTN